MNRPLTRLIALVCTVAALGTGPAHAAGSGFAQCLTTPLARYDGTIAEAAAATEALSTLYALVVQAGLGDALNGPGNLTVFAPTNDAFAAIPESVLGAIGSDNAVLTAVLTYHVVDGRADPRRSVLPREFTTLQGQSVFLDYDNGAQVNNSNVACQGVRTTNGTVWILDSVLLPQF